MKAKQKKEAEKKESCIHVWYDGGKRSTIRYSKCLRCGKEVYY